MFTFFLLLSTASLASPITENTIHTELRSNTFSASLETGFHFNTKAPNLLFAGDQKVAPQSLQTRNITFPLKNQSADYAKLYVCDDQETFCEMRAVQIGKVISHDRLLQQSASIRKESKNGFLQEDLAQALLLAKKKNSLVLIDFAAQWCPGCVRLEREIFPTKQFQEISRKFVRVHLDVDRFENFAAVENYSVKGIPALIVVDPQGRELSRMIDYQPLEKVAKFLQELERDPRPLDVLLADKGNSLVLGKRLFASGKYQAALRALEEGKAPVQLLRSARVLAAKEASDASPNNENLKSAYRSALKIALGEENSSSRSLQWRTDLAELVSATDKENLWKEGAALADSLIRDPKFLTAAIADDDLGEFFSLERLFIANYKAELAEAAASAEKVKLSAWSEAADIAVASHISPSQSGPILRELLILQKAKRWNEAEQLSLAILKADPANFDVQRRRVNLLNQLNRFAEASTLAKKILPFAEGRDQFWVSLSLAKAMVGLGKKQEARETIQRTLAQPEINLPKMLSTKKELEGLKSSLL